MPRGLRRRRTREDSGYTLIELLVIVLVLAILMAVALPLYLGALSKSEIQTCHNNMWTIAQAEQAYRARVNPHAYTTNMANLAGDLGTTPTCPAFGTYTVEISTGSQTAGNGQTVPAGGLIVACSATGHGVFAPGIDSN